MYITNFLICVHFFVCLEFTFRITFFICLLNHKLCCYFSTKKINLIQNI